MPQTSSCRCRTKACCPPDPTPRRRRAARYPRKPMIPARLEQILDSGAPAVQLAALFAEAGHSLLLVGGSVRDLILDVPHADLDFTTDARPGDIKRVVAGWADELFATGEEFGTVGVVKEGRVLEITTFPQRDLSGREPQAGRRVRRRYQDRPLETRLHHQRDGPSPSRSRDARSPRRPQ